MAAPGRANMDLSTAEEATEKESRANDASTSPGPRLTHAHDLTTGDDHDRKALVLRGEEPDEEGNPDLEIVLPEDDEWEEPPNPTHAAKTKATAANEANGNGTETNSAEAVQTNGLGNTAETNDHVNTAKAAEHPDSPSGVAETPKKKKNKRKPKSKRGLNAPSGFEEYYVDPPVTPAEYEVEKGLYHGSIAFSQRIETAIQRYCARRRLVTERKNVFDKYLAYGGITCGQKAFSGGLDQAALSDHTAQEIACMTATHFVPSNRDDPSLYVVDFERCAKGFFSTRTIRNFLNYLLHHDIAPEHRSGILAARTVCDQAEDQLCKIRHLNRFLPGKFQTACSEIFGGMLRGLGVRPDQEWNKDCGLTSEDDEEQIGISPDKAKQTFKVGLAAQATDDVLQKYENQGKDKSITTTLEIPNCGLEIIAIIPPDSEIQTLYTHPSAAGLRPLGKVIAKEWHPPDFPVEDKPSNLQSFSATPSTFEFYIEDYLLAQIFPGLKLIATVRQLSFGICYFDAVFGVYCSFYDALPNGLMGNWVEPGPDLPFRDRNAEAETELKVEETWKGDEEREGKDFGEDGVERAKEVNGEAHGKQTEG